MPVNTAVAFGQMSSLRKTAQQKGLRFRNEWPRLEGTPQPN